MEAIQNHDIAKEFKQRMTNLYKMAVESRERSTQATNEFFEKLEACGQKLVDEGKLSPEDFANYCSQNKV